MKKIVMSMIVLFTMSFFLSAVDGVDGVILAGEYEHHQELRKAELYWESTGEVLKVGISADTKGWLALGLGSPRMDGYSMFMGYVKDGESFFEEHLGRGHSHSRVENDRQVNSSLQEVDGTTTMEFSLPLSDFLPGSHGAIPVILAYGSRDNFTSMHRYRDSAEFNF